MHTTIKNRFDVSEAAGRLGIAPFTLRRMVRERKIAHFRPSPHGKIYFSEQQLADFEQRHTFDVIEDQGVKEKAA